MPRVPHHVLIYTYLQGFASSQFHIRVRGKVKLTSQCLVFMHILIFCHLTARQLWVQHFKETQSIRFKIWPERTNNTIEYHQAHTNPNPLVQFLHEEYSWAIQIVEIVIDDRNYALQKQQL
jgi:hypothetical protein